MTVLMGVASYPSRWRGNPQPGPTNPGPSPGNPTPFPIPRNTTDRPASEHAVKGRGAPNPN